MVIQIPYRTVILVVTRSVDMRPAYKNARKVFPFEYLKHFYIACKINVKNCVGRNVRSHFVLANFST